MLVEDNDKEENCRATRHSRRIFPGGNFYNCSRDTAGDSTASLLLSGTTGTREGEAFICMNVGSSYCRGLHKEH